MPKEKKQKNNKEKKVSKKTSNNITKKSKRRKRNLINNKEVRYKEVKKNKEKRNLSSQERIMKTMKEMGLPTSFDSTKGKEVPDCNHSGVRLKSKRNYRQYMNHKGSYNRVLAKSY